MTPEKTIEIRDFAINWIEKVHNRSRKSTRAECRELLTDLIADDPSYDSYDVLSWDGWDHVEGRSGRSASSFWDECRDMCFWGRIYRQRVIDLCETACRVAIDLLVKPSGGVVGYCIKDLKKAFDGTIPQWVSDAYADCYKGEFDGVFCLNQRPDNEGIWL